MATTVLWLASLDYLGPSRLPEDLHCPRTEDGPQDASTARGSTMQAHRHGVSSGSGEMAMVLTGSPAPIILVVSSLLLRSYLKMPAGCRWLGDQGLIDLRQTRMRECNDSLPRAGTIPAHGKLVGVVGKLFSIEPIRPWLKRSSSQEQRWKKEKRR